MHRVILGLQKGDKRDCDHRDGNGLNNQRANLRICSRSQNTRNSRKTKRKTTSKYKGVYHDKVHRKWIAKIQVRGKQRRIGLFHLEKAAARAYNKAALKHFGEFARLNVF